MATRNSATRLAVRNYPYYLNLVRDGVTAQYVDFGQSTHLNDDTQDAVTCLAWIKTTQLLSNPTMAIGFIGPTVSSSWFFTINGSFQVQAKISNGSVADTKTSDVVLQAKHKYLVGMIYEKGSTLAAVVNNNIYSKTPIIDNVKSATNFRYGTASGLTISGNYKQGACIVLKGVITQAQLNDFYYYDILPSGIDVALYTPMRDGSGTTVSDESGNDIDGTTSGSPIWTNDGAFTLRSLAASRTVTNSRTLV